MDEVIINCDEGRLRRPLVVLKNGKTVLTRKHLEDVREGTLAWSDLIREGVIEWIDAEEEEDALIAVEPFESRTAARTAATRYRQTDVDWMNPGGVGRAGDPALQALRRTARRPRCC